MRTYSPLLEEENKQFGLLFNEPEALYLTGQDQRNTLLHKQRAAQSFHKFLIFSSGSVSLSTSLDVISLSELGFPANPYHSLGSSVTVNCYSDIDFLKDAFQFVNPDEVKQFLLYHPEIIQHILDCHIEILTRFDIVTPKMELVTDAELSDWKTLFITIPHNSEYEESFELLNDLLQNWAFYQSKQFKQLVTITLE